MHHLIYRTPTLNLNVPYSLSDESNFLLCSIPEIYIYIYTPLTLDILMAYARLFTHDNILKFHFVQLMSDEAIILSFLVFK